MVNVKRVMNAIWVYLTTNQEWFVKMNLANVLNQRSNVIQTAIAGQFVLHHVLWLIVIWKLTNVYALVIYKHVYLGMRLPIYINK